MRGRLFLAFWLLACGSFFVRAGDWPMFGGSACRNGVSAEKNIPAEWDIKSKQNVKWVAPLGSLTYGTPIIAGGRIYVATNNGGEFRSHSKGDRGVVLCLDEKTGALLWQATHEKLASGPVNDWPDQGVASNPCVENGRVFYVSNRCELVCADAEGFRDGENDGPYTGEKFTEQEDADFIWILDMMGELGVFPRNLAACSPVIGGDLVFVCTGNGINDEGDVPAPDAPSFIAVDKNTGKIVWKRSDPGKNIINGQWSSPAYGVIAGKPQAIFGGGDGWCYAFEATTGQPLWKFNLNPPDAVSKPHGGGTKTAIVATPVIFENKVFLASGDDPESGSGPGHLYCIDATKSGDVSDTGKIWHAGGEDFGRTISNVAIADGLLYAADLSGYLYCFEAASGKPAWKHDMMAGVWGSPAVIDGKVFLASTDGEVYVLKQGRELEQLALMDMKQAIYSTPTAANGVLYITTRKELDAIAGGVASDRKDEAGDSTPPSTSRPAPTTAAPATSAPTTPPAPKSPPPADAPPTSAKWPMFRGNPRLTGVAGCALPDELAVRWRYEVKEPITSTAAIAGDTVYVGCDDGNLYALNLADGTPRWKFATGEMIASSPTVVGDLIVWGNDVGLIHACDARTGKLRWKYETGGEIISSAVPYKDHVLVGSYDGYLYCLNLADGKPVWKYAAEERVHSTPAVVEGCALFGGCDGHLHVVDLETGARKGHYSLGSVTGASAAVEGSFAYLGTYGEQVLGVDWREGKTLWHYENPERGNPFMSSAALRDGLVLIGGRDKLLHALDAKTGQQRWQLAAKDRIDGSPVIVGDRVYVGDGGGILHAAELATGKEVWRFETGGGIWASPAAGEGCLVISTDEGVVYCFGEKQ